MSETTPRLSLPLIGDHSQKRIVMNAALMKLEAMVQAQALSRTTAAQPSSPLDGDSYILPASPTGAFWSLFPAGSFLRAEGGTWEVVTFPEGAIVHIRNEHIFLIRTATGWAPFEDVLRLLSNLTGLGIGTVPDAYNVLAVKGPAALLSAKPAAEGGSGDISLSLNKESDGDTAQILLQKGYSSRAILGLLGDNTLSLKVSPDGAAWTTALTAAGNGKVSARWGIQPPTWPMKSTLGAGGKRLGPIGMAATNNAAATANRLYVVPVAVPYDLTAVALSVRVTTGASGNVRLGIYADNQGQPGALVVDAGTLSTTTAGLLELTLSQPLSAGLYWLAAAFNAAPAVNMAVSAAMGHDSASAISATVTGYYRAFTYAALPADESAQVYTALSGTAPALLVG